MPFLYALRLLASIGLWFLISLASAQTTVVSVTSTTTIHATATDNSNACNNFYGACVVYGDNGQGAAYTTTVYASGTSPSLTPTSLITSTTTVPASTTATDAATCKSFDGSCVVYGSGGSGEYTTTSYAATSSLGNSGGYIAKSTDRDSPGYIGAASSLSASWMLVCGTFAAMALSRWC